MLNPYEQESELENSYWADVCYHMETTGDSKEEAEAVVSTMSCYQSRGL